MRSVWFKSIKCYLPQRTRCHHDTSNINVTLRWSWCWMLKIFFWSLRNPRHQLLFGCWPSALLWCPSMSVWKRIHVPLDPPPLCEPVQLACQSTQCHLNRLRVPAAPLWKPHQAANLTDYFEMQISEKEERTLNVLVSVSLFWHLHCLLSLSLLFSLNRLETPHRSFTPNIYAYTITNQIPKTILAVQPHRGSARRPNLRLFTFFFTVWTAVNTTGDKMEWPVVMLGKKKKRGEGKGKVGVIHVSHITALWRKRVGEETCKANGVPHPGGRSAGEYFHRSFITLYTFPPHTHTQESSELTVNLLSGCLGFDCSWKWWFHRLH